MADKPILAAAFLCEQLLEQKDDVLSAIRIVDTYSVAIAPNMPQDVKPGIPLKGLISFKRVSLEAKGEKYEVRMRLLLPSGKIQPLPSQEMNFKPDLLTGFNLIISFALGVEEFGLFWLEASLDDDDEMIARIPFRLLQAVPPPIH